MLGVNLTISRKTVAAGRTSQFQENPPLPSPVTWVSGITGRTIPLGKDIKEIPLDQLNRRSPIFPQDNYLFGHAIVTISCRKLNATDAEVEALAKSCSGCDGFIRSWIKDMIPSAARRTSFGGREAARISIAEPC